MSWINLKTEGTFGAVYGHIDQVVQTIADQGGLMAGIADKDGTWMHVRWQKACKKAGIKPIYGVTLTVVSEEDFKVRRARRAEVTLVAMDLLGLQEIYGLVDKAHQQFYYFPRIKYAQLNALSESVAVIVGPGIEFKKLNHRLAFQRLQPGDPKTFQSSFALPPIACVDNWYPQIEDRMIYEPFADERKLERKTSPQYILTSEEWSSEFPGQTEALKNLRWVATNANVTLPKAQMVRYFKQMDIRAYCENAAPKRKIDLTDPIYKERFEREINLIVEKEYADYFFVVADVIQYAKKHMVVGPARGSSAGSLVCYLMGITEVDPIPWGLYFERFIDVNRFDLPDIDVDFQDDKRHLVINYLRKKYGADNVAQIGNINRLKPRSAIIRFAKALNIPPEDVDEVKDAILERSGGDSRAAQCMEDTFNDTDIGKRFIQQHPNMKVVAKIEQHASHTGVHAAGILVCNEPITHFAGINSRDKATRIAMLDKKDAEALNLLKIDALGLRTLSIFADVCDAINKPYGWLYDIPLDDPATFKTFNDQRLTGIFQFEGGAMRSLARQMPIETMEDVSALSALSRPGPLNSGGATEYIERRRGTKITEYMTAHPIIKAATKSTYGVVIYQEQVLHLGREYGGLSWADTSELRKAMSKSLGEEFFNQYKVKFIAGAVDKGETEEDAIKVWKNINTHGSWSFNKSHSISYSIISYLCGYLKTHHPMEFAVACLNHAKNDSTALKLLRDLHEYEGIEYVAFDVGLSEEKWSVHNGKLYGGLTTLHGIGPANARKIIELRSADKPFPPGIQKAIDTGDTPFKYLYPGREKYGEYYKNPKALGITRKVKEIKKVTKDGSHVIIGQLIRKNVRDANEIANVAKRGGQYVTGPTSWINITLEDDTDAIICTIGRYDYEKMGREIAETGREGKDWYLVYGVMKNGWRKIYVKNIRRITT